MADAMSRMTSGDKVGVFACQNGPGIENAFGSVAQAFSENVPLVVIPGGMPRAVHNVRPTFNAALNFKHITKSAETVTTPDMLVPALRRAFSMARNGRPGPCLVEIPADVWTLEVPGRAQLHAERNGYSSRRIPTRSTRRPRRCSTRECR